MEDSSFWDELAIQSYKSLLKKKPHASFLHKNIALAYLRTNKENKAIRALQRAIKYDSDCMEAYYHLGTIYRNDGNEKEAMQCFKHYQRLLNNLREDPRKPDKAPSIVEDLMKLAAKPKFSE